MLSSRHDDESGSLVDVDYPCPSEAAVAYVWKDDTAVPNTRFELGSKPVHRGDPKDWDAIFESAAKGDLMAIPADVRVRQYNSLKRIAMDHCEPVTVDRSVRARL